MTIFIEILLTRPNEKAVRRDICLNGLNNSQFFVLAKGSKMRLCRAM